MKDSCDDCGYSECVCQPRKFSMPLIDWAHMIAVALSFAIGLLVILWGLASLIYMRCE